MLGMTSDRTYLGIKKLREGFFSLVIEEKGRNELFKNLPGCVDGNFSFKGQ
jgi:hypothetical protein